MFRCVETLTKTYADGFGPGTVPSCWETSPIPPTPIWAAISYGPMRVPGLSATQ